MGQTHVTDWKSYMPASHRLTFGTSLIHPISVLAHSRQMAAERDGRHEWDHLLTAFNNQQDAIRFLLIHITSEQPTRYK